MAPIAASQMTRSTGSLMANSLRLNEKIYRPGWRLNRFAQPKCLPRRSAWKLFAPHSQEPVPAQASLDEAKQLESAFWRRRVLGALKMQMAAALLVAAGWAANSLTEPLVRRATVDENFILAAREALRVAQLDAGPAPGNELDHDKIERLVGAINITMPQLPAAWVVTDVQVQP